VLNSEGNKQNTDFCIGGRELRDSAALPAGLSAFRPHPAGRDWWKLHGSQDLSSELSVLVANTNCGQAAPRGQSHCFQVLTSSSPPYRTERIREIMWFSGHVLIVLSPAWQQTPTAGRQLLEASLSVFKPQPAVSQPVKEKERAGAGGGTCGSQTLCSRASVLPSSKYPLLTGSSRDRALHQPYAHAMFLQ
jgi:hypothetical protein